MRQLTKHLNPPMAVALLALFVALGGTGYAALRLPAKSVGTAQLKPGAVTSSRVRNKALTPDDIKLGPLARALPPVRRAHNADGATNAQNAVNATNAQTAGNASKLGGESLEQLTAQLKDHCPSGAVLDGGGCIETSLRGAATWPAAAAQCGRSGGGRLPTAAELSAYEFNGRPTSNQAEWTSDILSIVDSLTFTVVLKNTGTGERSTDQSNHSQAFRCVVSPSN